MVSPRHLGDIAGCIEMNAGFDEDLQGLFGQRPYECPSRPGDELNMGMFQLHLQRFVNNIFCWNKIVTAI